MNETANATLALGALPVMAHAREEVEEMVALAGALVLNIGTLSPHWVDAMLAAGRVANEREIPVVLDPVGAGATRYRTETAKRILDEVRVTRAARQRGRGGDARRRRGRGARRRVDRRRRRPAELAAGGAQASASSRRSPAPVDHVSDGRRIVAIENGDPLLASITGTGCMSSALTGCFLAVNARPAARGGGRGARRVRRRRRGRRARREGPRLVPRRALRRAGGARSRDARRRREAR